VLAQVPVGAAVGATVLDTVSVLTGDGDLRVGARRSARALRSVGVAAALPTALAGWSDFSDLHPEQQRVGLVHAAGNLTAVTLWSLSLVRRDGRLLFAAGTAIAGASAALGGHLGHRWAASANHAEDVPHRAPEGWQRLCELAELPDGEPHRLQLGEVPLVAVRDGQRVRALASACSHLSGPLHEGSAESVHGKDCVVCPWHGSAFSLDAGDVVRGPATAPQPRVEVDVHDGLVFGRLAPA
jgi:nitrite reductase/ring-hydroxylating ferredoxin subunit